MQGPQDGGLNDFLASAGGSVAAALAIAWKFSKSYPKFTAIAVLTLIGGGTSYGTKTDPRQVLVWANEPLMRPVQEDLRMVKQVVIRLPGADSVLAQLQAEKDSTNRYKRDSAERARWEQ